MIKKFISVPQTVEAIQLTRTNIDEVMMFTNGLLKNINEDSHGRIVGILYANQEGEAYYNIEEKDYIVKDPGGDFEVFSENDFNECFEDSDEPVDMGYIMISQPMNGLTENEIKAVRENAIEVCEKMGFKVIDTYFDKEWADPKSMEQRGVKQIPVAFLSKSIEKMAECDAVYFCKGWDKARGCKIEHDIATQYGLRIFEEIYSRL